MVDLDVTVVVGETASGGPFGAVQGALTVVVLIEVTGMKTVAVLHAAEALVAKSK